MINKTTTQQLHPNKHVYVLRIWRTKEGQPWRYTVVTPNVDQKHHFHTLADAMAFVDPQTEIASQVGK